MKIFCFGNSHVWAFLNCPQKNNEEITKSYGSLEISAWKLGDSGATAYGLMKKNSRTGAGETIQTILNSILGKKEILMVFGMVDITDHIGKHGTEIQQSVVETIEKYKEYLQLLNSRGDIAHIFVASSIPFSKNFQPENFERLNNISNLWNAHLKKMCIDNNFKFVDWYTALDLAENDALDGHIPDSLALAPNDKNETHMNENASPIMMGVLGSVINSVYPSEANCDDQDFVTSKSVNLLKREIEISEDDSKIARLVLERDFTCRPSFNGLKDLLSLSSEQESLLFSLLRKII